MAEKVRWIAHINHVFPLTRQTFTYREVSALRDEGLPVKTFSMKKPEFDLLSEEAKPYFESTYYLPFFLCICTLLINIKQFIKTPKKFTVWFFRIIFAPYSEHRGVREFIQSVFQFLRAGVLANKIKKHDGFPHLHVQFADGAATTALIAADYLDTTFSFYSHTSNNVQLLREKILKAEFIFSISEFDKKLLCECAPEAADKIHIVHCGIPLGRWKFKPSQRDVKQIISVGGLDEVKGHHILLDACKILNDSGYNIKCNIIGEGPYRKILEQRIASYNLEGCVRLSGIMPQEAIKPLLYDAGVFVLACVQIENGDMDGIPVALMEAMAVGTPVISTKLSGIAELINDGDDGFLVESKDAEVLAEKIKYVLDNYEKTESLCKNAEKR